MRCFENSRRKSSGFETSWRWEFPAVVQACECDARGRLGFAQAPYPQGARLLRALALAQAIDTESVATAAVGAGLLSAHPACVPRPRYFA